MTHQKKARRAVRHYKPCKQCGTRFLARRAGMDFHAPKCRVRWNRAHADDTRTCKASPGATENTGVADCLFALTPVIAQSPIEALASNKRTTGNTFSGYTYISVWRIFLLC